MQLTQKVSDWMERHEHAVSIGIPLSMGGIASAMLMSLDPSKMDDPQAAELLIAGQEAISSSFFLVVRIITNPFILAIFIFLGVSLFLISRSDQGDR
jgi:hypothetical protein